MSFEITTAFVEQYKANIMTLAQQEGSVLREGVRKDTQVGKNAFVEQIDATAAKKRTERHGDTPLISTQHKRRRISLIDFDWADLIDDLDKVRMLIDPQSTYALNAGWAMGRAMDQEIITAMNGDAFSGVSGGTTVTLPSSQKIVASSSGLTVAKLREARKILRANNIPEGEPLFIATTAEQIDNLLGTTEVTSSDFNTVKALAQGDVNSFMGFKFLHTELLTVDGSSARLILAWAINGVQLNIGKEVVARMTERADKNYSLQVFLSMAIGTTRLEEKRVVQIACTE